MDPKLRYKPTIHEMATDIRKDFPLAYHKAAQRRQRKAAKKLRPRSR